MKNFLSFLLVLIFSVGSFGVVFADEEDGISEPDVEPEATAESCGAQSMTFSNGKCVSCPEDAPEYDSGIGGCVTRKAICLSNPAKAWSDSCTNVNATTNPEGTAGSCCILKETYCNDKKEAYNEETLSCEKCNLPEVYDDTIKDCHNPNITPSTVLPGTEFVETDCEKLFLLEANSPGMLKDIVLGRDEVSVPGFKLDDKKYKPGEVPSAKVSPLDVLGCAIKTGRVGLWMIPFYIKYFIQFTLSLAGLVAVGSIVIGGYFYLFGAFADDKDKGKRAIIYGIVGFIVAILSWTIVNIVISILTR